MILAIDPGNIQSAYVLMDDKYTHYSFGKIDNDDMLDIINNSQFDHIAIEMIQHYGTGMAAGKTVFDTCVWIGRFIESANRKGIKTKLIYRGEVKRNLCGMVRAKDGNVIQALKDRFGDKGTKAAPGFFYGFKADCWQAYAVGVTYIDSEFSKGM